MYTYREIKNVREFRWMSPSKHYCLPVLCSAGVRFPRSSTSKQRNREGATSPTASFTIQDKTPQPQISGLQTNLTNKPDPDAYMASEFHSPMRIFFLKNPMRNFTLHRPTQHGLNHMVKGGLVKDSCPSLKHFLRARTEHQTMIHHRLQLCFL